MKRQLAITMYIFVLLIGVGAAETSAFEILQYPGAVDTWPEDIHDGVIVGRYRSSSDVIHGFVYDGSTYSTLDFPGSLYTTLFGTDGTNIVGAYYDSANRQTGFLFDGNSFTAIAPPDTTLGFNGATANGVDGQTIVGSYRNTSGESSGFVFDGSTYATFNPSTEGIYVPLDIEGDKIVGQCFAEGIWHGFSYDGETTLNLFHADADSPLGTRATGVSGDRIVGYYSEGPFVKHTFIYEQGEYRMYDVPASLGDDTEIRGIHGDEIVGYYIGTSGSYHGFVATIPEPHAIQLLAVVCLSCLGVRRPCIRMFGRGRAS